VAQDKKVTAAFIKQRQENRELREKLAQATATPPPSPIQVTPTEAAQPVVRVPALAPVVKAVESTLAEEKAVIQDLAADTDLSKIPGAVIDLIDLVDTDSRLSRLNKIDPTLAYREGKAILMQKYGVAPAPVVPLSATPSGGMGGGRTNLESLYKEIEKYQPGSRQFSELANKINAEERARNKIPA
jgi:hypothetical protein